MIAVENALDADFIAFIGPIDDGHFRILKSVVEDLAGQRDRLAVLLETSGGFIESAERMARLFRHHYDVVDFFIVSFAMSAGTVLAMSGDDIYMDYASTLGPIDPQIQPADSRTLVPALGYLEQYKRLIRKSDRGTLTSAELAYLIQHFNPGELYQYEQARALSIALLEEWLVNYKFKNWTKTETRGRKVTDAMRKSRAKEIGRKLNDTKRWRSHSRGISMDVLRRDLKLVIKDIEDDSGLAEQLSEYFDLLSDYSLRRGAGWVVIHSREGYFGH